MVTKPLHETEAKVELAQFEIRKKLISLSVICAPLTVRTQPLPRFHVEAWLPFRNCEMDYYNNNVGTA